MLVVAHRVAVANSTILEAGGDTSVTDSEIAATRTVKELIGVVGAELSMSDFTLVLLLIY